MAIHIRELSIDQFKGINNLSLRNLGDVNIILGDNNAGKTSILELLLCMHEPASLWNIRNAFRGNGLLGTTLFDGMMGLFPVDGELKIRYRFTIDDGEKDIIINGKIDSNQVEVKEIYRLNGYTTLEENNKEANWLVDAKCLRVDISVNGQDSAHYDIFDFLRRTPEDNNGIEFYPSIYIPPAIQNQDFVNLSAVLERPQMQEKLINILKVYDESISYVQAIKSQYGVDYKIVSNKHKVGVPVSYYGDGMKKAIELFSAAVFISGGILLIDEFETSIHTSAMTDTYRRLMEIVKELNVQVFMTTHSKEALEKLMGLEVLETMDFKVHTVFDDKGKHLVRTLNLQEARKATNQWGMDLR